MNDTLSLMAITPIDGRYRKKTQDLAAFFSEQALMKYRLKIEIEYFIFFLKEILKKSLPEKDERYLKNLVTKFDHNACLQIKDIEKKTNHDVKSIEYYLREQMKLKNIKYDEYIHIGLTSEDINSIAYALGLQQALEVVLILAIQKVVTKLSELSREYKATPMLARTHGQPAVPTTLGKEFVIFAKRLNNQLTKLKQQKIEAKCNGAVGNYNSLSFAYPEINWTEKSQRFIEGFGLTPCNYTNQIVPGDTYVLLFQHVSMLNTILIGFCQDMWRYISDDYFNLKVESEHVGSSTMPQKVNPIDFENAEGNLGLANGLITYFENKLPISRLQRDLSDSTVKRNFGTVFAYSLLGYTYCLSGLEKISINKKKIDQDISEHSECLTEAIQTVLRISGDKHAYEKLKHFSRGKDVSKKDVADFIDTLQLPSTLMDKIKSLKTENYIGTAKELTEQALEEIV
jgi:adenylosuccinate lyase